MKLCHCTLIDYWTFEWSTLYVLYLTMEAYQTLQLMPYTVTLPGDQRKEEGRHHRAAEKASRAIQEELSEIRSMIGRLDLTY